MQVNFRTSWFGPDSTHYKVRNNPNEVPEIYRDQLPPGAEILDDDGDVEEVAPAADPAPKTGEKLAVPPVKK